MEEVEITEEIQKKYLQSPNHCPFCGTNEINADRPEADDNTVTINVECSICHMCWTDIYILQGLDNAFLNDES